MEALLKMKLSCSQCGGIKRGGLNLLTTSLEGLPPEKDLPCSMHKHECSFEAASGPRAILQLSMGMNDSMPYLNKGLVLLGAAWRSSQQAGTVVRGHLEELL